MDALATVDQLICSDTMMWDVDLLDRVFLPRDVEAIKSIPLSQHRPSDILTWTGTKRGVFSVRSAYHMLLNQSHAGKATSSSSSGGQRKQLWLGVEINPRPASTRPAPPRLCNRVSGRVFKTETGLKRVLIGF